MSKLFICGDIINQFVNGSFIDDYVTNIISECDYNICNLEGSVRDVNDEFIPMTQVSSTLFTLKKSNFNLLLLANNHITDCGKEGLSKTLSLAATLNFDTIGAGFSYNEVYKPLIKSIQGQNFAFFNICEAQPGYFKDSSTDFGYAWIGDPNLEQRIKSVRNQVDYLLIFVHAGLEHYSLPLVGYRKLYRRFCDLGADVVIGAHPHVPQGIEEYHNSLIFYSLGNFFFQRQPDESYKDNPENASYSIVLEFLQNSKSYLIVPHKIQNSLVCFDRREDILLKYESLSRNLEENNYNILIKQQNLLASDLVINLYKQALLAVPCSSSLLNRLRFCMKYLFFLHEFFIKNQSYRQKLLLRLTENESYRFLLTDILENEEFDKSNF